MTSIRTKLFLNISLLITCFVLISWGLSSLILEPVYMWHKKQGVLEQSQAIAALYQVNPQEISLELERSASNLGAGIVIFSPEGSVKYSSFARIIDQTIVNMEPPKPPHPPLILLSREEIDNQSVIEMEQDPALNVKFMVLKKALRNQDILVIRLPLAAIAESTAYASRFMIFTGLLLILAGCCWAFFFAKKFTNPLLELSRIAQSISELDFSQKCAIHSQDEVGRLAKSINHLSYQLNQAIIDLNQKNQQLTADVEHERRLDKMRQNFISSVSHELKTPIALILGYAEGLRENVAKDEESKNYYSAVIIDEAEKMDRLVKDLLNLSQIESGFYHLERSDFDLSLLVDDILVKYWPLLSDQQIALQIEKEPHILVNADTLRMEQVIVNLLNNAINHVDNNNLIKISIVPNKDKVRLYLYNTGQPIPEDSLSNLWLSFYKVDQARTRELGGYGLGLSIVRAIQELHGNGYGVKNVQDGVLFWFDLSQAD